MTAVKQEEADTTSDISGSQITHGNAQKYTYDCFYIGKNVSSSSLMHAI